MGLTARKINLFIITKLPSAFFCGVRVKSISSISCSTSVRFRWINQNPFKSMFWAVQGMAAELATGALVMQQIKECGMPVSMLLVKQEGEFTKKAIGKITFECNDGLKFKEVLQRCIETKEGQTIQMISIGKDEHENIVSNFRFEWSVKLRS